jgi:hypothetical protein
MLQTLDDMVEDQPTATSKNLIKTKAYMELPLSIVQQNFVVASASFFNDTPDYARQTSTVGAILMIPFFLIILTDATERPGLTSSTVWVAVLTVSLLALPALAFVINTLSYLVWLRGSNGHKKSSLRARVFSFKQTWPMLAVGGAGLALCLIVLFHNSAHCIIGNPVRTVHNPSQTWQCISRGFLGGSS